MKKILWAINPFESWLTQGAAMAEVLRDLTRGGSTAIHPVSFFSREEAQWLAYATGSTEEEVVTSVGVRNSLERYLSTLKVPGLREMRFLSEERVTPTLFASEILGLAESEKADGIALVTHGRTGPERWNYGSFTETLLRRSPVPVLVLNPGKSRERKLGAILVPTDFRPASRAVFEKAVEIAAVRGVPLVLLHETVSFDAEAIDPATAWSDWAKERGVIVRQRLESVPKTTAQAIVDCARELKVGLILMATEAGAVRAALGGSVARQVVRDADCPVLVWHP